MSTLVNRTNILINRTNILTLSIATTAFLLASNLASAEIYKWRNNRGVIQYSDKQPVAGFTKADRHELVNALQAKDLCAEPTAKTLAVASAFTRKISANFLNLGGDGGINNSPSTVNFGSQPVTVVGVSVAPKPVVVATAPKPVTVASPSPLTTGNISSVTTGNTSAISPTNAALLQQYKNTGLIGGMTVAAWAALSPANAALVQQYKNSLSTAGGVTTSPVPAASPAPIPTVVATAPTTSTPSPSIPNIIQSALLPSVDISKNMLPITGYNSLRVQATSEQPNAGGDEGAFRIECAVSHMSNDDPIVYPNQQGAAHHHTFFGNTSTNYKTNVATLSTTGNSTCNGGVMNRSAYWVPSMIDTATNTPIVPKKILVYYKTANFAKVIAPPKQLRMIAGDGKATVPQASGAVRYTCNEDYNSRKPYIPNCSGQMEVLLHFPSCWDGKNLDSPNHKDHMAYEEGNSCPASHPVMIPRISFNVYYAAPAGTSKWRLASDNYAGGTGGNSFHGDWMNGWDEAFSKVFTDNCLKRGLDCHAHLLGDGRTFL